MKKIYIKDNIYGFIEIDSQNIKEIIDNPFFQRLRYIKQGLPNSLVYPSANHTRFEHSLGVYHLTKQILNKTNLENDEKEKLAICALIHDAGHGPFSHTSEKILEMDHEKQLLKLLKNLLENTNYTKEEIEKTLKSKKFLIVSGDFGTDRMDYLVRDSTNTGAYYGLIDWQLLIKEFQLLNNKIVFNKKIESALDNFLLERHFISKNVYYHKTVVKIQEMLRDAFKELLNYFKKEEIFSMTDYEVLYFFKKYEIKIFDQIMRRKLWKTVLITNEEKNIPKKYYNNENYLITKRDWRIKELNTFLLDTCSYFVFEKKF